MMGKVASYIRLFNPMDIVFALEGTVTWRKGLYSDYYAKHTKIRYDKSGFYVFYDNQVIKISKTETGEFFLEKLKYGESYDHLPLISIDKLSESARTAIKTVLPAYKGNRKGRPWEFLTPKKEWENFRDEFALLVAPIFRGRTVRMLEAEGDDVMYVSTTYLEKQYSSIVMVTGDSDMNQLLNQKNLIIYNHRNENLVQCLNPTNYLDAKVLSGDDSDNINGIVLPGKKQQLGEKTAQTLLDSVGNCYEAAKRDGWDNQYERNRKLIDLSFVPTHIQRSICEMLDQSRPDIAPVHAIHDLGITEKIVNAINGMREIGYYSLHPYQKTQDNPDLFKDFLVTTQKAFDA